MILKTLPDKYIRKAIIDIFKSSSINNFFDSRQPNIDNGNINDNPYILLGVQSNSVLNSKCENYWLSTIKIEVVQYFNSTGNAINRAPVEDLLNDVILALNSLENISLSTPDNQTILTTKFNIPTDIVTPGINKSIIRKILSIDMKIA